MLGSSALVRATPQLRVAARQMSVISGPPKVRVSFAEKSVHGLVISAAILAVPMWVLANVKNYRSHE